MEHGAFSKSIAEAKARGKFPPGVWAHDWSLPVAKTLEATEASDGLHVVGQFNLETQRGRETYSDIKAGIITEYSFGFKTVDADRKDGARHIKAVDWFEWSPVLIGANRETRTVAVKGAEPSDTALIQRVAALLRADTLSPEAKALLGLETAPPAGLTYDDHSSKVLAAVEELAGRTREIAALRAKEGRALASHRRVRLQEMLANMQQMTNLIADLLTETEPTARTADAGSDPQQLYVQFQRNVARLNSAIP